MTIQNIMLFDADGTRVRCLSDKTGAIDADFVPKTFRSNPIRVDVNRVRFEQTLSEMGYTIYNKTKNSIPDIGLVRRVYQK